LPHEKPEQNKTSFGLIVGLTGLQAEFDDNPEAISNLTESEALLAARYAMDELNGFPTWLDMLAATHPAAVKQVFCECIRGEWQFTADHKDTHEVLSSLAWRGGALTKLVGDEVLSLLTERDPQNYSIHRSALTILAGQENPPLKELTELAARRARDTTNFKGKILWLRLWMYTDGDSALEYLETALKEVSNPDEMVVNICSALSGEEMGHGTSIAAPSYLQPACLRRFIPLVYAHVKIADDLDRSGGAYSPTARDHAQRFRDVILDMLAKNESPSATEKLCELADDPCMSRVRDWILHLIEGRLERQSDLVPWTPGELQTFAQHHEVDPKSDRELFVIAQKRILELKFDVEKSDNSLRDEIPRDSKEMHLRRWLARRLNERANNRYTVPQEPEIDYKQRPDLQFLRAGLPSVPVEVKLADLGWSIPTLLERLENQLVGQYLRDHKTHYGIYVIGTLGQQQHWQHPQTGEKLAFGKVIDLVSERAGELMKTNPHIGNLAVVGIDFSESKR
jgi:hypothetical protein